MNFSRAEQVAKAVLYEGYILYPYRPTTAKNRQRWTFGGIYPRQHCEEQRGSDAWRQQTECLVRGDAQTRIEIRLRFLHLQERQVGALDEPIADLPLAGEPNFRPAPSLRVGGKLYQTWQEATEREVVAADLSPADLVERPREYGFAFPAARQIEALREPGGPVIGVIVRRQEQISGVLEVSATPAGAGLFRLSLRAVNLTPIDAALLGDRDDVVLRAFVSSHTLLAVADGEFVSLTDPPAEWRKAVAACHNEGTWPVLVGEEGDHDLLLSSPIILYDYPQLAPESPGDLFDGTEIDEILTLRILTMTDEEKEEMRDVDDRARELLERTEAMPAEQFMKMHGVIRSLRSREEQR